MKITYLFILLACLTLFSCNSPLDKTYNEDTLETDLKEIVESKKVDTTDLNYIGMYIMRANMLGESLEGKTYNDILKNARELRKKAEADEAEEKALADKAAQEEKLKREVFSKTLTVALYDKGYFEGDYEEYLTYKVAYENKGTKDIRAIKGELLITDLFDTEIKRITMVEDNGLLAGQKMNKTYTTDYNQFMDEDTQLRSKDMEDIKVFWIPEKIIFNDGTTLE